MQGTFWHQDYFDFLSKLFVFVSIALHKLSTERRRHDVHVLFDDDVSYYVRNAHLCVNNKVKRKFTLFSMHTIKFSSRVMKNIQIFTRASHS